MLKVAVVKKWDYNDLVDWLQNTNSMEDDFFDLKEQYSAGINPAKIRKCFSSFANTKGGVVLFGINNLKVPIGCPDDPEMRTKLNRILTSNLDPKIDWEMTHSIALPSNQSPPRFVYITRIKESIFLNKPHISDGKIYIREMGECKESNEA